MEPEPDGETTKVLSIHEIPHDLYWAIMGLKTHFRSETWIDFWKTIVAAQIEPKDPMISTTVEPTGNILVQDIPQETFNLLRELKVRFRAKTWIDFLAALATATITPQGQTRPTTDTDQKEVAP